MSEQSSQSYSDDHWDLEIKPEIGLFDFRLSDAWKYRDLLILFISRDFIAQYKQTVLGPLWHFLQPAMTTLIFLLVFNKIARIPTDHIPPVLFYLSGITLWNYFSLCLTQTSNTFVANAAIFGKVYFPRVIMPLALIISNLIRFGVQLTLLAATMIYYHFHGFAIDVNARIALIPILLFLIAGMAFGMGIIVSSITTRYRDFSVLLTFGVQLYMYATPIVYPLSRLKDTPYEAIINLNPLTPVVEAFRYCLFGQGTASGYDLLYTLLFMTIVLMIGLVLFHRVEKTFMDTV